MEKVYTLLIGFNSELAQYFLLNTALDIKNLILVTHKNKPSKNKNLILKKYGEANVVICEADLSNQLGYSKVVKFLNSYRIIRCFYFSANNKKDSKVKLKNIDHFYNLNSFSPLKLVHNSIFEKCHFILIGSLLAFIPLENKKNYAISKYILNLNFKLMPNKPAIINFGPIESKKTNPRILINLSKNNFVKYLDKIAKNKNKGIFVYPGFWRIFIPMLKVFFR